MSTTSRLFRGNGVLGRLRAMGLSPIGLILLLGLLGASLFVKNDYYFRLLTISCLLGSQAMAFDFTTGFIGVVNFGFSAFFGLGAYVSAVLAVQLGVSPWLGLLAGAAAAALMGLATGMLTLRLRGLFAACMTWFLALTLQKLTTVSMDLTGGAKGLLVPSLLDTVFSRPYFYVILAMTGLCYVTLSLVAGSRIGLAFRAIGENELVARASGVNPTKYKVLNFTLSCAFAGLLGGFYAHFIGVLTPPVMDTANTLEVLTLAYVGGRGSIWGGLAAALVLTPAFQYLQYLLAYKLIIYGGLLVSIMLLFPDGLAGLYSRVVHRARPRQEQTPVSVPE